MIPSPLFIAFYQKRNPSVVGKNDCFVCFVYFLHTMSYKMSYTNWSKFQKGEKARKKRKNRLTNEKESGRIYKHSRESNHRKSFEKTPKKLEKSLAKGIDKGKRKWYNNRVAAKKAEALIFEN